MFNRLRIWWWKWRFTDALLSKVAKERTGVVIRFCEACAADAWAWNYNESKRGKLGDALAVDPRALAVGMTRGSLSSFHVLHSPSTTGHDR
jgi:hypothetical protein